jgi:hypothetical protein
MGLVSFERENSTEIYILRHSYETGFEAEQGVK